MKLYCHQYTPLLRGMKFVRPIQPEKLISFTNIYTSTMDDRMKVRLRSLMPEPLPATAPERINALREVMQSVALLALWRARFFEHAAFYGGTALRILYGLDRFSEDLDFSLLSPATDFRFSAYENALINEFESWGFKVRFESKQKQSNTSIESAFLKTDTLKHLLLIEAPVREISPHAVLKIKLEVDTRPPQDFETEMKYVFSPLQFAVRSYTLPCLFAGKLHAVLFRRWRNRVKGRDWYDLVWYISRHPNLSLRHLEARMRQSGDYVSTEPLSRGMVMELLSQTIDRLNIDQAKAEVSPFVNDRQNLDIWSRDFFHEAVGKIVFQSV